MPEFDLYGQTSLMLVALYGEVEMLKLLCELGASLDIRDNAGETVLHKAASTEIDAVEKLLYLLEVQNVHCCGLDNRGRTALFPAVEFGDVDVVELMCQKGFDLQKRDEHGTSLLHSSCKPRLQDLNSMRIATACEDVEIKRRVRHIAAGKQALDIVQFILKGGVDVNAMDEYGRTPLHYATEFRQSDTMKLLLQNAANPCSRDTMGMTPLHRYATIEDGIDSKSFLSASVPTSVPTSTMFERKALPDLVPDLNGECISLLLEYGAKLDIQDDKGRTALHVAAERKTPGTAKLFLEKGANLCAVDLQDRAPIHIAAGNGGIGCVKLFLEKDANLNSVDQHGWTPLHYAAKGAFLELYDILVDKGADQYACDKQGRTPRRIRRIATDYPKQIYFEKYSDGSDNSTVTSVDPCSFEYLDFPSSSASRECGSLANRLEERDRIGVSAPYEAGEDGKTIIYLRTGNGGNATQPHDNAS
ncbi:ankyrin repeat, PH and SEC7 domain containing protein secG-like [Haliotis rubra]|uniref:ankyrin repeat, PH and SEC7 domain containing protein secG-like n=1 Tax=Haliotis rubra TaxID=36100 RepID=UPI001EE5CE6A|nr:ankyrin repeat, PH and SEC7 domain containing protein secG-like [Haliotis rubra]